MLHFFSIWCTVLFGRPVYLGALLFVVNVTWTHKSVADFLIVYDVVARPGRGRISYKTLGHLWRSGINNDESTTLMMVTTMMI